MDAAFPKMVWCYDERYVYGDYTGYFEAKLTRDGDYHGFPVSKDEIPKEIVDNHARN